MMNGIKFSGVYKVNLEMPNSDRGFSHYEVGKVADKLNQQKTFSGEEAKKLIINDVNMLSKGKAEFYVFSDDSMGNDYTHYNNNKPKRLKKAGNPDWPNFLTFWFTPNPITKLLDAVTGKREDGLNKKIQTKAKEQLDVKINPSLEITEINVSRL